MRYEWASVKETTQVMPLERRSVWCVKARDADFLTLGGLNVTLNLTVITGRGETFSLLKLGFDIELHYK